MPAPTEPTLPVDTVGQLLTNALQDAGIVGIDEDVEQAVLNRAFIQANWLLAEWAASRSLAYQLVDYSFVSTGAQSYTVGQGQTVNINPRPDRLEYAYMRILAPASPGTGTPVDIQLDIIPSKEDYARITVKSIGNFAWRVFYDPVWPVGLLYPWPIPQASLYEIHVGFKVVLPRFQSIGQPINFPPEYESALNWCLAERLRASYQMPADATVTKLTRNALNKIRLRNTAMPTLQMPRALRGRRRSYDYRGDQP